MLTLLVTILATAYFIVPELLTRFVVGLFFIRKATTGTRSEEIMRGAFWAVAPLCAAWLTRNHGWFAVPQTTIQDVQTVFSGLFSEKLFDANPAAFYIAFGKFAAFNALLLLRTYLLVVSFATLFGAIALRLGAVRVKLKNWPRVNAFLHWAFMPRISEWHVALSPMLVHKRKNLFVRIDVMTKGDILYRGTVYEKRISSDGDLATLVLQNAERMVRADYLRDRAAYEDNKSNDKSLHKPNTEDYWRKIPGELFLVKGSEISSVNIRHIRSVAALKPKENRKLADALAAIQTEMDKQIKKLA